MHRPRHVLPEAPAQVPLEHEPLEEEDIAEDGEREEESDSLAPQHGDVVLDGVEEGGDQERVVHEEQEHEAQVLQQDGVVRALGREVRTFDFSLGKNK